jgi:hypothetical protein
VRPHHRLVAGAALGAALATTLLVIGGETDRPSTTSHVPGVVVDGISANASCVGPYLDDQPPGARFGTAAPTVSPGETLVVYGHWFTSICNDTGGNDPVLPLAPVRLSLTLPGGQIVPLGQFTARGPDMGFHVEVDVPAGARAGTATIRSDHNVAPPYRFAVVTNG